MRPRTIRLVLIAIASALFTSSPVDARRTAAGGALTIGADLTRLVPGVDRAAQLTITSEHPFSRLELQASTGEVTRLESLGENRWSARYNVPAGDLPQVVILTATAQGMKGRIVGWRTLLIGKEEPARPVVFGWTRPAEVSGEEPSGAWLYLFAAAQDGRPYSGMPPQVSFTRGSFDALRRIGSSAWRVKLGVPAGAETELMISVRLPGSTAEELIVRLKRVRGRRTSDGIPEYVEPPEYEPVERPEPDGLRPLYFWLGVGTSVAVAAAGLGTRIAALDVSSEYDEIYDDPETPYERKLELQGRGQDLMLASNVLFGVGGAAALVTAFLFFCTDFSDPPPVTAALGSGFAGLRFSTSF
jgi:hypothetical protein